MFRGHNQISMRRNFNQQAALTIFGAAVLVFVICVGITRFYSKEEITLIGGLVFWIVALAVFWIVALAVFWIVALAACILTGFMVPIHLSKPVTIFEPKDFIKKRKRKKKRGPGRPKKKS